MTYRRPARVAFVVVPPAGQSDEPTVYLMHLPDGDPHRLAGTAALIWVLASEGDADVPAALSELVGESREEIAAHVDHYLAELVEQGWLEGVHD